MNTTSIVTVIFVAILLVGAIETIYQIYKLTVIDATARGLKHPKLLGLLATSTNNSSGLLLYLIGRRNYPIQSLTSEQATQMEQRKRSAGIGLIFLVAGAIGCILSIARYI